MTTLLAASNDRMVLVIGLTLVAGIYLLSIFFSRPVKWSRVFLVIVVWSVVLNWALLNYIDDRQFVVPKDF